MRMLYTYLFIIIFLLISGGIIGYLYFFKELPEQEKAEKKVYANIFAYENGIKTQTDYKIFVGNKEYANGTTSNIGGVREQVPINRTIEIYNYNQEDQNYYIDKIKFKSSPEEENRRVDLELEKAGIFNITSFENLSNGQFADLELTTDKLLKNIGLCMKRSNNILYSQIINSEFLKLKVVEAPSELYNYDKCYKYNKSEITEEDVINIEIKYLLYNTLKLNDFIEFVFFDSDKIN